MEKRAFERTNTNLPVRYFCDCIFHSGTIKNISKNGLYISTSNFLPCRDTIEMIIPLKNEVSKFKAQIRRIEKVNDSMFNIGVEVMDPPASYSDFVESLKSSNKPFIHLSSSIPDNI